MTGGWSKENVKHCHFRAYNSSGELFFKDVRKFGNMKILTKNELNNKHIAEFDLLNRKYNFKKHFKFLNKNNKSKRSICSILMDQSFFPGVGNYIKSEALSLQIYILKKNGLNYQSLKNPTCQKNKDNNDK